MIAAAREKYNALFTEQKYTQFLESLYTRFEKKIEFKVCETPVFIPQWLKEKLLTAGEEIIDVFVRDDFKKLTAQSIPQKNYVPHEDEHTLFLALDFGICKNEKGEILPQLIEMQGFPSLHAYQNELGKKYMQYFDIDNSLKYLFNNLNEETYTEILKKAILGNYAPENVILLEVEPEKQKTWVDFWITREMIGIEPVCISKIVHENKNLFYEKSGKKIPIHRIYNRVIFDEFELRKDLQCKWNLTEDANIEWAGHPNWFFRISKYTLPFIKSRFVPDTFFLSEIISIPHDLENWVLKPLFSFAGSGIIFNVTKNDIQKITHPEQYILQRKVNYYPCIKTPDMPAKCEIRLMYIWLPGNARPQLVINLARMSKGEMIGVNFNKNKDWVGGTVAYFE